MRAVLLQMRSTSDRARGFFRGSLRTVHLKLKQASAVKGRAWDLISLSTPIKASALKTGARRINQTAPALFQPGRFLPSLKAEWRSDPRRATFLDQIEYKIGGTT